MAQCSQCSYDNPLHATFCGGCGRGLQQVDVDEPPLRVDLVGQTLHDRYYVEAKLGEGGMGSVYRAQDTRLTRKVALKVLAADLIAHPTARRRMTQEANALARIEHANVVRVFDVFDHDQLLVIVMELVTGGDLSKQIRPGGLPESQAVTLIDGILAGLGAIHTAGLIHRDVKPENVLLTATGEPKMTDLGVARDSQAQQKTQLGARLGTPEYMSPEQAQGLAVDARSDLYAVGLILFELLTGSRPFSGTSEFELMAARVQQAPDLRSLSGRCSAALQQVVATALARDVDHRYANAEAMRQAVAEAERRPVAVAVPARTPTAPPSLRQNAEQMQSRNAHPVAKPASGAPAKGGNTVLTIVGLAVGLGIAAVVGVSVVASKSASSSAPDSPAPSALAAQSSPSAEAPAPAPAPSAAPAPASFIPDGDACAWSMTMKSRWLHPGEQLTAMLRGAVHPYTSVIGQRGLGQSSITLTGPQRITVEVPGKSLLTVKTWAPQPDLEWVIGFWYGAGSVTLSFTRIVAGEVSTKQLALQAATVSDELDGHYLWLKYDAAHSTQHCVLQVGTDLGILNDRGKSSKPSQSVYLGLPESANQGWPAMLAGSDWATDGSLR